MVISRLAGLQPDNPIRAFGTIQSIVSAGYAGTSSGTNAADDAESALEEGFRVTKMGLLDAFSTTFDVLQDAP